MVVIPTLGFEVKKEVTSCIGKCKEFIDIIKFVSAHNTHVVRISITVENYDTKQKLKIT